MDQKLQKKLSYTKIFIFFVVVLSTILSFYKITECNKKANKNLYSKLTNKEKEYLEFFFRTAFDEDFAYVLFGNKPMAKCSFNKLNLCENHKIKPIYLIAKSIHDTYHPINRKFKKGWDTWKKYQKIFLSDNFIIKSETNPKNDGVELIVIINKSLFIKTIDQFKDDFKNVLGSTFDAQKLLRQCENGENLFTDLLKNHEGLIGTLLGYGRENAWNYYERDLLEKQTAQLSDNSEMIKQKIIDLNNKLVIFSPEDCKILDDFFSTINQSENHIEKYLANLPNLLSLPQFSANPNSAETQKLKEIYSQDRKNIKKIYENKNFLSVTLDRLQNVN